MAKFEEDEHFKCIIFPPNIDPTENNLNSILTSPQEVESILKSLKLGKASGPDEISNHILNKLATPLSRPLSYLFIFFSGHCQSSLSLERGKCDPNI